MKKLILSILSAFLIIKLVKFIFNPTILGMIFAFVCIYYYTLNH